MNCSIPKEKVSAIASRAKNEYATVFFRYVTVLVCLVGNAWE